MAKIFHTAALLLLAFATHGAHAAPQNTFDDEDLLRRELQHALWPADIVHLATEYLNRYPVGSASGLAVALRERASDTMRVLSRSDVRLYRNAFRPAADTSDQQDELRRAALGDKDAAMRLAHQYGQYSQGDGPALQDQSRYVGWLQYAAMLGNETASYELARHYRRQSQPVLASQYEARAVELGYTLPRDLDHSRK